MPLLAALFLSISFSMISVIELVERFFVFFPEKNIASTPDRVGLSFEDHFFVTPSGRRLHGWLIKGNGAGSEQGPSISLLFFHGNAGNISHRLEKLSLLSELGESVFIFDYAGFGRSEGRPSEQNLYEDAHAAQAYLTQLRPNQPILLYGESLGCAAAIHVAASRQVGGIILEAAFYNLHSMARRYYPFLAFLAKDRYDNAAKIGRIRAPILFIHAETDQVTPISEGRRLFDSAQAPKGGLWLPSGDHNNAFWVERETYQQGLKDFMKRLR